MSDREIVVPTPKPKSIVPRILLIQVGFLSILHLIFSGFFFVSNLNCSGSRFEVAFWDWNLNLFTWEFRNVQLFKMLMFSWFIYVVGVEFDQCETLLVVFRSFVFNFEDFEVSIVE